jgi:hypothetical protein
MNEQREMHLVRKCLFWSTDQYLVAALPLAKLRVLSSDKLLGEECFLVVTERTTSYQHCSQTFTR